MSENRSQVYTCKQLNCIPDFTKARLLIVGDIMLDQYYQGDSYRISPEAPVPVVNVNEINNRPGGAANVALNAAKLGAKVVLLGLSGMDQASEEIENTLDDLGIECHLLRNSQIKTIKKLRVLSRNQQLLRLDFEQSLNDVDKSELFEQFQKNLCNADIVVFSDYAKGTLSDISKMIELAKSNGKPVIVDPKGNDYSKYSGATVITPNLHEFNMALGVSNSESELQEKARELGEKYDISNVLLTRSEHGMTLFEMPDKCSSSDSSKFSQNIVSCTHFPSIAKEVYDVTGAGDTVVSTLSCALAVGSEHNFASALANYAASIVVTKLGTSFVTIEELNLIFPKKSLNQRILSKAQLIEEVKQAKSKGKKIVMTNGCFDILHSGHVMYLEQAAELGDRLIVAVNSDKTVTELKGEGRPINNLMRRMTVLASLESVDWVVEFEENTPEKLIGEILPNVLVKGGDYIGEEIAGARQVLGNGGQVLTLDYEEGISTTDIISKFRPSNK